MRAGLTLGLIFASIFAASASDPRLTEDQKKEAMGAFFRLAMADECNKRWDDEEIFELAKDSAAALMAGFGVPNADDLVQKAAKEMEEKPRQPSGAISLASRKLCADIKQKLKSERQ